MKKIAILLLIILAGIVVLFYASSLDDGGVVVREVDNPVSVRISDDFVYLVSLEGFFTEEEIQKVRNADASVSYILHSGHERQRRADKEQNFKTAKEFIDISERDFSVIKQIKIKGTFLTDDIYYDIISDSAGKHYLRHSPESMTGDPGGRW
jgi:hypothetical protein